MKLAITAFLMLGIVILLGFRYKKKSSNNSKIKPIEFLEKIDSLGYFEYARKENLDKLRQSHIDSFDQGGSWGGIWDDKTGTPLDYRYYFCDGESVYEQDGFTEMLATLKPTFEKINFHMDVSDHYEEWDSKNEWLDHSITINNTHYIIFRNFKGYGWGEAVQRLAEILNSEFEKQNIKERIYLISGGNDGSLIFLNDGLYEYFSDVFTDPQWKPLHVNEWIRVMKIKPMVLK